MVDSSLFTCRVEGATEPQTALRRDVHPFDETYEIEGESPDVDAAFVAAVVRLRDAANAARPHVKPPGPPVPPRGPAEWMRA